MCQVGLVSGDTEESESEAELELMSGERAGGWESVTCDQVRCTPVLYRAVQCTPVLYKALQCTPVKVRNDRFCEPVLYTVLYCLGA